MSIFLVDCEVDRERHPPATPHRPNPELRMVEPLCTSATASSADAYTLDPPRLDTAGEV